MDTNQRKWTGWTLNYLNLLGLVLKGLFIYWSFISWYLFTSIKFRRGVTKRDFSIIPTFQGQKTQKAQKVQEEKIIETESDHQQMQVDWGDDSVSYSPTPSLPERSQVFSPSPSILRIKRTAGFFYLFNN